MPQCKALESKDRNLPLYNYCPSKAVAVLFLFLFAGNVIAHIFLAVKWKKAFCWVVIMGAIWETAGYAFRVISIADDPLSRTWFIPMSLFLLLAPLWLNAFDYMLFGRLVHYFLPGETIIGLKAKRLALLFVCLDIGAFFVQVIGAVSTVSNNAHTQKIGFDIYTGGVGLQQAFLFFFTALVVIFHRRMRNPAHRAPARTTKWKPILYTLYASITFLSIRILYRIVEFGRGANSTEQTHEAYYYVFDAVPILISFILWSLEHPGPVLQGPEASLRRKNQGANRDLTDGLGDNTPLHYLRSK